MATLFNEYVFVLFIYFKCTSFAFIFLFVIFLWNLLLALVDSVHILYLNISSVAVCYLADRGPLYRLPFFNFLIKMFSFSSFHLVLFKVHVWNCNVINKQLMTTELKYKTEGNSVFSYFVILGKKNFMLLFWQGTVEHRRALGSAIEIFFKFWAKSQNSFVRKKVRSSEIKKKKSQNVWGKT